jgi:hypothetical protein
MRRITRKLIIRKIIITAIRDSIALEEKEESGLGVADSEGTAARGETTWRGS